MALDETLLPVGLLLAFFVSFRHYTDCQELIVFIFSQLGLERVRNLFEVT